jgi:hypothetical protein
MKTETFTANLNQSTDPFADVYGRQAVWTSSWDGTTKIGVVEPSAKFGGIRPIIRFENGQWAMGAEIMELVKVGA